MPIGKSERVYRYAVTGWIVDTAGAQVCYEFGSKIDEEARITCFLYVRFKYSLLRRLFRRGQIGKSRFIARVEADESEFLYHFNTVRQTVWREYGHQIPFRFRGPEELTTIQFSRGFLGRVGFNLIKVWRAVVDLLRSA